MALMMISSNETGMQRKTAVCAIANDGTIAAMEHPESSVE